MTNASKKRKFKQKDDQSKWKSRLWSFIISFFGLSLILYLFFFFIVPNLLPVERKLLAIVTTKGAGNFQTGEPAVLLVGLDPDARYNQAVWVDGTLAAAEIDKNHETQTTLSYQLGLLINDLILIDQAWPDEVDSTQLAMVMQTEFWRQLKTEKTISTDLFLSWYLLKKSNSFSKVENLTKLPKEFARNWGSVLKAGDDCQIAVLNSTDIAGLAGNLTDIIERNGGVVVRLKQFPTELTRTKIYVDETAACKKVVTSIQSLFVNKPEILPMEAAQDAYRAPLVIILGIDQADFVGSGNESVEGENLDIEDPSDEEAGQE